MNLFWLDATTIIKRYIPEKGTILTNYLFVHVPPGVLVCLLQGIGEAISIFIRRRNEGKITDQVCRQILSDLHTDIIDRAEVENVFPTEGQVTDSWELIMDHSINSTDAIILRCALDKAAELRSNGHDLVMVSSDLRLLRASRAEGLITFDPENDDQHILDSLLN